ncbi:hypothetical protein [Kitasatospora sp. NPDC097643]|uniref:hypothetical protein n=1 Tax=Kitasatospora sp. NPDC097643 TaxID=3157230 RepID=UPI0033280814
MPGQGKRRRRQRERIERNAARFAPEAGHWEVLFETQDEAQWHAHIRRLRASDPQIDWSAMRLEMFCGRLTQPTTHRLSRFVPDPAPDPGPDPAPDSGPDPAPDSGPNPAS